MPKVPTDLEFYLHMEGGGFICSRQIVIGH
jgi:hypothetical protein